MRKVHAKNLMIIIVGCILLSGCKEKYDNWYSVIIENKGVKTIRDFKISNWGRDVGAGIMETGVSSNCGSVASVPNETTITWKTALPGGEEYLKKREQYHDEYIKSRKFEELQIDEMWPEGESYPADLFQDHSATIDLSKIPKKGFYGKIYFTFQEDNKVKMTFKQGESPFKED